MAVATKTVSEAQEQHLHRMNGNDRVRDAGVWTDGYRHCLTARLSGEAHVGRK